MSHIFTFEKEVDPGAVHRALVIASFLVIGVTYDSGRNQTTIILEDAETKDPTTAVTNYVYVPYVPPNYPVLYANAQAIVDGALTTYNTAVAGYITALSTYNTALAAYATAGIPVTSGNAVAHIQPIANAVQAIAAENSAFALAFPAIKDSIAALVNVVSVLAQRVNILEDE